MIITFDQATIFDVLDVAFNHSIKKNILTPQIAELLKEQEKNNLITDDNARLTEFGKALFKKLNISYTSETIITSTPWYSNQQQLNIKKGK